jgi:hypothetical protein
MLFFHQLGWNRLGWNQQNGKEHGRKKYVMSQEGEPGTDTIFVPRSLHFKSFGEERDIVPPLRSL